MKQRITALALLLALCLSLTVPALAADSTERWDTDAASWPAGRNYCVNSDWTTRLQIEGLYRTGYVKYSDGDDYATVCYCTAPARVNVSKTADIMDLGGSLRRYSVAADGTLTREDAVQPTWQNAIPSDEGWTMNGVGTYWTLEEGLYYLFSVNASNTLFVVVGDPFETAQTTPSFADVTAGAWYTEAVYWAVQEGITNGTGGSRFSPDRTCTQAEILTFLWRAAGEPKPSGTSAYSNAAVTAGQYYYDALLWAWEEGIVTNKALAPSAQCQRSDVVTYLWRLSGKPATGGSAFTDVPASADYAKAVAWAVDAGITTGTGGQKFSPQVTCSRAQIVTFLHRYFV